MLEMTAIDYYNQYINENDFNLRDGVLEYLGYDYEYFIGLHDINLKIDDDAKDFNTLIKYPYFQLRGKSITEQQAFDIISRTDNTISPYAFYCDKFIGSINFDNSWFCKFSSNGWVHPDGTIGLNSCSSKWPTLHEFIEEWVRNVYHFPYLDLMICVAGWIADANAPKPYDSQMNSYSYMKKHKSLYQSFKDKNHPFYDAVNIGIHVHDKTVEILSPKNALSKYKEYNLKYGGSYDFDKDNYYDEELKKKYPQKEYLQHCINALNIAQD